MVVGVFFVLSLLIAVFMENYHEFQEESPPEFQEAPYFATAS